LKHVKAERVGLLVPATDVRALLIAYQTPQPAAAEAVNRVVTELFNSVAYLHVKNHLETRDIGKYAALREFHIGVVSDDFGDIREHKVDRLIAHGDDSAECDVQVVTGNGVARYRFRLAREWGDWAIREAHRVR
jgi:hypothetical protein